MPKTPDEIKKGLECCTGNLLDCESCPYSEIIICQQVLKDDALALIQRLQAKNAEKAETIERLNTGVHELIIKIQQLEAERDAAIADMTEMARSVGESVCEWCDRTECECTCAEIGIYAGFNWRGVQKEE